MADLSTERALVVSSAAARPRWRGREKHRRRHVKLDIYVPGAFLLALCFCCFVLPELVTMPAAVNGNILYANLPIGSPGHLLGTDPLGNDELARIFAGGRVSLEVGAATQVIGLLLGGVVGMWAGYVGGLMDGLLMRVLDVLIAFPSLVLVLAIVVGLGPSEMHIIWALSFFSVPAFARLARSGTLRLRDYPFMVSARVSGRGAADVIRRHVAPSVFPQLLTFALLGAGVAIILEGALSYLGYGIRPPGPSWGNMIAEGQLVMSAHPNLVVVPSVALLFTVVALNVLGDALRVRWADR